VIRKAARLKKKTPRGRGAQHKTFLQPRTKGEEKVLADSNLPNEGGSHRRTYRENDSGRERMRIKGAPVLLFTRVEKNGGTP